MTMSVPHTAPKYIQPGCEPWCNDHQQSDPEAGIGAFCRHSRATELGEVEAYLDDDGHLVMEPYIAYGTTMTAAQAADFASAINAVSAVMDAAALPEPGRQAVRVEHVALIAGVPDIEVRHALAAGELKSHPALDGSQRVLIDFEDARTWANA